MSKQGWRSHCCQSGPGCPACPSTPSLRSRSASTATRVRAASQYPHDSISYAIRISALVASLAGIVSVKVPAVTVCDPNVWTLIARLLCVEL